MCGAHVQCTPLYSASYLQSEVLGPPLLSLPRKCVVVVLFKNILPIFAQQFPQGAHFLDFATKVHKKTLIFFTSI